MAYEKAVGKIENFVFSHRVAIMVVFFAMTGFMAYMAMQTHFSASFRKMEPIHHPYIQTYLKYRSEFGSADKVLVSLYQKKGNMFNKTFFNKLQAVTNAVFFIPGVDRSHVKSIFTPNVIYIEVTEQGLKGGNVIPSKFTPGKKSFEKVRQNIIKSGQIGRLVTANFHGAMVQADLLNRNPDTGKKIDYIKIAHQLQHIREKYQTPNIRVHIIGFAVVTGDIAAAVGNVVTFFGITVLATALLLYLYAGSWVLTWLPLFKTSIAVVWMFGLLNLLGYGLDPLSILVPFLIFAIGVSHGVQVTNGWIQDTLEGAPTPLEASKGAFRRLLVPGSTAVLTDTVAFMTIILINIQMIRDVAILATLGVFSILLTNLFLLPVLLSYVKLKNLDTFRRRQERRKAAMDKIWHYISALTQRGPALVAVGIAILLLAFGLFEGRNVKVGAQHPGVPELRANSLYNRDARAITRHYSIGTDVLTIYAQTDKNACTNFQVMDNIDRFSWRMNNVPGVRSVVSLPLEARQVNAQYHEGDPKYAMLPRNHYVLSQSLYPIQTSTGLLNNSCDVMPVYIFLTNHKASTIDTVVAAAKKFGKDYHLKGSGSHAKKGKGNAQSSGGGGGNNAYNAKMPLSFALAGGTVGVMAATNDVVRAAQFPIQIWIWVAVLFLTLFTFRSIRASFCVLLPLALVSTVAYAVMAIMHIGLKVSTLPVVALGVGIGVDYGIYIFSMFQMYIERGEDMRTAYYHALQTTGKAVLFTALTLAVGVVTWLFSPLKFQADMGLVLAYMFVVNMLGAILLLPAAAHFLLNVDKMRAKAVARSKG